MRMLRVRLHEAWKSFRQPYRFASATLSPPCPGWLYLDGKPYTRVEACQITMTENEYAFSMSAAGIEYEAKFSNPPLPWFMQDDAPEVEP